MLTIARPSTYLLALVLGLFAGTSIVAAEPNAVTGKIGLERRALWTSSKITGTPTPPPPYSTEHVFQSLTFTQPAELVALPDGKSLAVLEVGGVIYSFANQPTAANVDRHEFADLRQIDPNFHRLYGLAFHPKFAENRTCYVCYVLKGKVEGGSRVSKFRVTSTDPPRLDLASEEIVITWVAGGHNGGHLQFGPDGYLYITTGDGGESFPPDGRNTGQDISDLMASVLRIDVDQRQGDLPYRIPSDNPFVGTRGARGEVWAFGLRNPWKICFNPADGSLWTGDVGWEMWEMIYRIERGGNYGWSLVEGPQPVHQERTRGPTPILPPTVAHDHTEARSITGGYFYMSNRLPELRGAYVYGDYVTGKIWGLRHEAGQVTWRQELVDTPLQIVTFGLDHQGEVYIVDFAGTLHRLTPTAQRVANANFPKRLSETGLFTDTAKHITAPGVIPYSINAEPWSDGATSERFVALPGESQLGTFKKTDVQIGFIAGDFEFPLDGVLVKTVSIELTPGMPESRRRLETQILHCDDDMWRGYNYVWNDEQTDAELIDEGRDRVLHIADRSQPSGKRQQTWHHASRTECLLCHTTRSGTVQGFKLPQLSRSHNYSGTLADQLATFEHIGLFAEPLSPERTPWPDPHDASADLTQRARAYLHVNCAHCHRRGGGGSAAFDVQYSLPLAKTGLIGTRPTQGTFNIHSAQVIAPGSPSQSVLFYRLAKLGSGRMPQFGAHTIDSRGLQLMHDWIVSLGEPSTPALPTRVELSELDSRLSTTSGALQIAAVLNHGTLADSARHTIVARGMKHADPLVRDLFERFIPEEQRVKRLGTNVKPDAILKLSGDATRGKKLFLETATVQCKNCHRVGEQGRLVGPDLTMIAKKLDRAKLLESILEPSRTIDPAFVTHLAETADGRVLSGLLVRRSDTEIVLRDIEAKEITLAVKDIEQFTPQQKSLMPELLLRDLTAEQVADLLAYLTTLK
jgi:uncharacterized repeat protein (TIGR03806 family)